MLIIITSVFPVLGSTVKCYWNEFEKKFVFKCYPYLHLLSCVHINTGNPLADFMLTYKRSHFPVLPYWHQPMEIHPVNFSIFLYFLSPELIVFVFCFDTAILNVFRNCTFSYKPPTMKW